jgi:hypothetical protein
MIDVFIGSQGSGKSLTSIHYLFEPIETVKEDSEGKEKIVKVPRHTLYKRLITCVGGFKPELFKKLSGNNDIEIIHYEKHLNKDDLLEIFEEQKLEETKPQEDRVPTLFIYDECQFGLSTFSQSVAQVETCESISNFFSLQRHYGPCDILLMTQSLDKINKKYLGDDFHLYISLEYSKKKDPENEIIFDLYDCDGKSIITGGRNKINYKKSKKIKDVDGNEFNPFDLYVSGDGGRKPVKKRSYWKKYIYILFALILSILFVFIYVFYLMFDDMKSSVSSSDKNITLKNTQPILNKSKLNYKKFINVKDKNSTFDKYIEEPYNNIDSQVLYRAYVNKNICYLGTQILSLKNFYKFVDENKMFIVSRQPITVNSYYVNLLIHQSLLNSFGFVKDHDSSSDKRVKSSIKTK